MSEPRHPRPHAHRTSLRAEQQPAYSQVCHTPHYTTLGNNFYCHVSQIYLSEQINVTKGPLEWSGKIPTTLDHYDGPVVTLFAQILCNVCDTLSANNTGLDLQTPTCNHHLSPSSSPLSRCYS
jgi:hypothetical protein